MQRSKTLFILTASLTLLVAVAVLHATWGLASALLLLAAVALSVVIALVWASLTSLSGDAEMSLEEALFLAAPTVEEEQKRAVLRALKDLEYELFVGKISREDYEQLSQKYREDARRLIARADDSLGQRMELAEARLREALEQEDAPSSEQEPAEPAKKPKRSSKKPAKAKTASKKAASKQDPAKQDPAKQPDDEAADQLPTEAAAAPLEEEEQA